MKIGLVLAEPPVYSETFFNSKINGLIKEGFDVTLFVGKHGKTSTKARVVSSWPVYKKNPFFQLLLTLFAFASLLLRNPGNLFRFLKLEKASGKTQGECLKSLYLNAHILAHQLDWLHFGFATLTLGKENTAKAMQAKMAVSFRGFDISIYPLKHPGVYNQLWKNVDKVHAISDDLYKVAISLGLSADVPVTKITPAIDVNKFENKQGPVKIESPLKILTVARLHWKKGLSYALSALKILKDEGYAFQFDIIGDGPELEHLLFDVHDLGLEDDVKFLGKKSADEVAQAMQNAMVYLQPSIQEGFCNAVLEAQAAGLLCLVSNAEGLSENVLHEKTGWVIPKRNVKGLARQLKVIYEMSEKELHEMRINAIERVKEQFDVKDQVVAFSKFYKDE